MNIKNYTISNRYFCHPVASRQIIASQLAINRRTKLLGAIWLIWILFALCCQNMLPLQIGYLAAISCTIYQSIIQNINEDTPSCIPHVVLLMFGMAGPAEAAPFVLRFATIVVILIKLLFIFDQNYEDDKDTANTAKPTPFQLTIHDSARPAKLYILNQINRLLTYVQGWHFPDLPLYRWFSYAACYITLIYFILP